MEKYQIQTLNKSLKNWLELSRLRTLPLALCPVFLGIALSFSTTQGLNLVFYFCVFLTIALQILANWANDLGDGLKGTDTNRIGPERMLASGKISIKMLKKAIYSLASLIFLTIICFFLTYNLDVNVEILFIVLGFLCIISAVTYTWGQHAYGYKTLGDIMVFIFFGLVGTLGTAYLYAPQQFNLLYILPASALGFLSVAVLHANNLRDLENDKKCQKITLAVVLGVKKSKTYQVLLIVSAFLFFLIFFQIQAYAWYFYGSFLAFIPLFFSLYRTLYVENLQAMDRELPLIVLSTFSFCLLFLIQSYFF